MYISFRQIIVRRELVLECGRCGSLVTDKGVHADWHKALEGGHGAVLSEDQAVEHGLVPDPERTVPPTSSEVAREEERLRRITGRRDLRLYPFPAPVHAVPSVFMAAVYSHELDAYLVALRRAARDRAVIKHGAATTEAQVLEEYSAMEPEVERSWQEQRDRARSQELDASLRGLSERLDHEDGPQMVLARDDAAVVEVMRRQGATAAQIAREMELRRAQREQPSDAGLGPQPLTDPLTGRRRTPE